MKIGDTEEIHLPADDPVGYDLDFRHKIATALANTPDQQQVPEAVRTDADIKTWRQYLSPRRKTSKRAEYCRQVEGWHEQAAMAGLLEALLLSEATYDQIAMELGGLDPEAVRLYQSMFFNVRDGSGTLIDNLSLHARFAQDQQAGPNVPARVTWQRAGINGYQTLTTLLRAAVKADSAREDPIDQLVRQELLRRVLARQMGTRELILMQQTKMEIERARVEMAKHTGKDSEAWDLVQKLLGMVRPQVIAAQQHSEAQMQSIRNVQNTAAKIRASQPPADRGMEGLIPRGDTIQSQAPKKPARPGLPS